MSFTDSEVKAALIPAAVTLFVLQVFLKPCGSDTFIDLSWRLSINMISER